MSVKKVKGLRVIGEYDGIVSISSEKHQVILSNNLSQEQLLKLSKNPIAAGFIEKTTITVEASEG